MGSLSTCIITSASASPALAAGLSSLTSTISAPSEVDLVETPKKALFIGAGGGGGAKGSRGAIGPPDTLIILTFFNLGSFGSTFSPFNKT